MTLGRPDPSSSEAGESEPTAGDWHDHHRVAEYLDRVHSLPARHAGEEVLAELLEEPTGGAGRAMDLGCGDGRLVSLLLRSRPDLEEVVAVDTSPPMLAEARRRFAATPQVRIVEHDLRRDIRPLGRFEVIVSGFAIHHLDDDRKRELIAEVAEMLDPGGLFANLEVVASATPELHAEFRRRIGREADDPADRLADVETQVSWMRGAGLVQVDCLWRWRGFALLAGRSP